MSQSKPRPNRQPADDGGIPPLTQTTKDGRPYTRLPHAEEDIRRAYQADRSVWPDMAKGLVQPGGRLSSEAIVHLIRMLKLPGEETTLGLLVDELGRRIARIGQRWARGFDGATVDEIVLGVGQQILELILIDTPNRKSEFLEMSFDTAVKRRVLNEVEKRKDHPRVDQIVVPTADYAGGKTGVVNPVDVQPDDGPTPEDNAIASEEARLAPELLKTGLAAIRDPRHRQAVILRYLQDWPVTHQDPTIPTLCAHFGVSARQIQNWMTTAFRQVREAIGDRYDQ